MTLSLRRYLATFSFLVVAGCSAVGPDYAAPKAEASAQFVGGGSSALVDAAQVAWWKSLKEPLLNELIAKGLAQNLDIAASLERIEAARAQLGQTGENAQVTGGIGVQSTRRDAGVGRVRTNAVSGDANFVFDLFGGFRRGVEQAEAGLEQAQFNASTVRLGYLAELTSSYVNARYFQNAAEISRRTVASQNRTLELVRIRLDAGDASQLEVQQARQVLDRSKADLPILRANFEANVFRMATLLAQPAGPLLVQMQRGARLPSPNRIGKTGVPADLVRNRPDIRAAERALAAATAGIGVAEAQLYPSLNLRGDIAISSQGTWSFGPAIALPVLNRGVLAARRNAAISQAKQAEIEWRSAVLSATEDVQTSLSLLQGLNGQVAAFRRVTDASTNLVELSRASYENGASPITDVLDAETALSSSRFSLLGARRDLVLAWVELQVATGKGWLAP